MCIATYAVLNLIFLVLALGFAWPWLRHNRRHCIVVTLHLLALTAIFDSIAIHYGVFAYDITRLLGLYVIKAPIEDFAYAIAAALIVPRLWQLFGKRRGHNATKT